MCVLNFTKTNLYTLCVIVEYITECIKRSCSVKCNIFDCDTNNQCSFEHNVYNRNYCHSPSLCDIGAKSETIS